MEKYTYTNQALLEIMSKHRLNKRDVLNVLGTKDYNSLSRWMDGEGPIHIEAMLKLCNKFDVSPAEWFLHNGEPTEIEIKENPYQITKLVAGEGMVTENELLKVQLEHAKEINEIERNARVREDAIRRECQINFDKERVRLMDLVERLNNELIKMQRENNSKEHSIPTTYRVRESEPEDHQQ